jgi:pseudouridine-5'-phosphate glycosidase
VTLRIDPRVADALSTRRAVVALESTIFSHLGLPSPSNAEALHGCLTAIRDHGATAAITAVIDGVERVGLAESEHPLILGPARKAAERDLAVAVGQRWAVGATTVSASVALSARAGVKVFATGGIGGVHRGAETTGDISADLGAIARHPVVTVSAGAKAFLDLPRTLEHLEMLGVPVIGFECDEFPAFTVRSSGLALTHHTNDVAELARIARAQLAGGSGMLVVTPVPADVALAADELNAAIDGALASAAVGGITGAAVTPHVLAAIAAATKGDAVRANIALACNNADLAARLAVVLTD